MTSLQQLTFVGLNGQVAALERTTGELIWKWSSNRNGYVTLLVEQDCLVVSVNGYLYGLDPASGDQRWHNELKGWGTGVACLGSINQPGQGMTAAIAAQQAQAAAAAAGAAAAGS